MITSEMFFTTFLNVEHVYVKTKKREFTILVLHEGCNAVLCTGYLLKITPSYIGSADLAYEVVSMYGTLTAPVRSANFLLMCMVLTLSENSCV